MCYVSSHKIKKEKLEKLFTKKSLHIRGNTHIKSGRECTKLLSAVIPGEVWLLTESMCEKPKNKELQK